MTVFTDTWNSAFEAAPADTDNVSSGDDAIRTTRLAVREHLDVDHYMDIAGTTADHGEHRKVTLRVGSAPSNVADKGFLYAKDYNSKAELHYLDEDNNEIQITLAGAINVIPSGTKMLIYADTAPAGWTIDNTLDDKLVFVSKGSAAGGETGGGAHSTGTWTQPDHTHTTPDHAHQMPFGYWGNNFYWDVSPPYGTSGSFTASHGVTGSSLSPALATTLTSSTNGGNTGSSATASTWRPSAYVCIICSKD